MNKIEIKDDSTLIRNDEDFLCTEVDGETVIMNTSNGKYFGFNTVSTDIWKFLESSNSFKSLIDFLLNEYEVEREVCEKETKMVLMRMTLQNIVKLD